MRSIWRFPLMAIFVAFLGTVTVEARADWTSCDEEGNCTDYQDVPDWEVGNDWGWGGSNSGSGSGSTCTAGRIGKAWCAKCIGGYVDPVTLKKTGDDKCETKWPTDGACFCNLAQICNNGECFPVFCDGRGSCTYYR